MSIEPTKPKILLVDDEEGIRIAGKYALCEWYDMTTVENTAKALELLKKEKYDLILLDMMIRGEGPESGLDMLKIVNKEYNGLPVVILTGTVSWMQRGDELKQFGAVGYLIKPFGVKEAKEAVQTCLNGGKTDKVSEAT